MSLKRIDSKRLKYATKRGLLLDLNTMEADMKFPIVGRNAATGKLAPDKQQTIAWLDRKELKINDDGSWYMPMPRDEYVKNIDTVSKVVSR